MIQIKADTLSRRFNRTVFTTFEMEQPMSLPEELYLGMVLFAFTFYALLLATLAWLDHRLDAAPAKASIPSGKVAHALS